VRPLTVTERGWYIAPAGTVTAREVVVAAVTVAFTAPTYTILLPAIGLKLVPVTVTVVPTGPLPGENEVMVGTCAVAFIEKARVRKAAEKASTKVFISKYVFEDERK